MRNCRMGFFLSSILFALLNSHHAIAPTYYCSIHKRSDKDAERGEILSMSINRMKRLLRMDGFQDTNPYQANKCRYWQIMKNYVFKYARIALLLSVSI